MGGASARSKAMQVRSYAARLQLAHPALDGLPRAQLRLLRAVLLLERADLLRERLELLGVLLLLGRVGGRAVPLQRLHLRGERRALLRHGEQLGLDRLERVSHGRRTLAWPAFCRLLQDSLLELQHLPRSEGRGQVAQEGVRRGSGEGAASVWCWRGGGAAEVRRGCGGAAERVGVGGCLVEPLHLGVHLAAGRHVLELLLELLGREGLLLRALLRALRRRLTFHRRRRRCCALNCSLRGLRGQGQPA